MMSHILVHNVAAWPWIQVALAQSLADAAVIDYSLAMFAVMVGFLVRVNLFPDYILTDVLSAAIGANFVGKQGKDKDNAQPPDTDAGEDLFLLLVTAVAAIILNWTTPWDRLRAMYPWDGYELVVLLMNIVLEGIISQYNKRVFMDFLFSKGWSSLAEVVGMLVCSSLTEAGEFKLLTPKPDYWSWFGLGGVVLHVVVCFFSEEQAAREKRREQNARYQRYKKKLDQEHITLEIEDMADEAVETIRKNTGFPRWFWEEPVRDEVRHRGRNAEAQIRGAEADAGAHVMRVLDTTFGCFILWLEPFWVDPGLCYLILATVFMSLEMIQQLPQIKDLEKKLLAAAGKGSPMAQMTIQDVLVVWLWMYLLFRTLARLVLPPKFYEDVKDYLQFLILGGCFFLALPIRDELLFLWPFDINPLVFSFWLTTGMLALTLVISAVQAGFD